MGNNKINVQDVIDVNATPEVLMKALEDTDAHVRLCAAESPNATPEVLLKVLEDECWDIRLCAAQNPNATPEVLMKALRDKDADVREAAESRILKNPLLQLQMAAYRAKTAS